MRHHLAGGRRAAAALTFAAVVAAGVAVPATASVASPRVATLAVAATTTAKPHVTTAPKSVVVASGKTATFTVKASGTALTYRWYTSKDGTKWSAVSKATKSSYTVKATAALNGHRYRVVVKNAHGSVTSAAAKLTVAVTPKVTAQPKAVTVVSGKKATFTVKATGNALAYQWYAEAPGKKFAAIKGATKSSYALTTSAAKNGYSYRVVASNKAGKVTSSTAKLTVLTKPKVTVTQDQQYPFAENGAPVTLRVSATGGALKYQWRRITYYDNGDVSRDVIPGATGSTLAIAAARTADGGDYEVVVTNAAGSAVSADINLYVTSTWRDPFEPGQIAEFRDWAVRLDPYRLSTVLAHGDGTSALSTYFEGETADGDDAGHRSDLQYRLLVDGKAVGQAQTLVLDGTASGPVATANALTVADGKVDSAVWEITDTSDPAWPVVEYFGVGRVDRY